MNYRSVAELHRDVCDWSHRLPRDIDLIVGVPRSGLLAANMLALHRNLPLVSVEELIAGALPRFSARCGERKQRDMRRILIVDDSINEGGTLARVRSAIAAAQLDACVEFGAVYVAPGGERHVDHHACTLALPRLFEWNLMHHAVLASSCLDIDGVLCVDPTDEENDDGERYDAFLRGASPLVIPSVPVGWLVTSRLARYRTLTEAWLAEQGVNYRELVMLDAPDAATRRDAKMHGSFKAQVYRETGADLFIESDVAQAAEIAAATGKPVFCTDSRQMLHFPSAGANTASTATVAAHYETCARPHDERDWAGRTQHALSTLLEFVPPGATCIVIDDNQWGIGHAFASRRCVPFLERDGVYWGAPPDDDTAIREFQRLLDAGAQHLVIGFSAFWWLEHYAAFARWLRDRFAVAAEHENAIVFNLQTSRVTLEAAP